MGLMFVREVKIKSMKYIIFAKIHHVDDEGGL